MADDVPVVAVNDLARLREAPDEFVIVGAGKTATDTIVWLLVITILAIIASSIPARSAANVSVRESLTY